MNFVEPPAYGVYDLKQRRMLRVASGGRAAWTGKKLYQAPFREACEVAKAVAVEFGCTVAVKMVGVDWKNKEE